MTKLSFTFAAAASFAFASTAFAGSAEDIIAKEKCGNCHTAQTTKEGPIVELRSRRTSKGDAGAEAKLVEFLKTGGTRITRRSPRAMPTLKAVRRDRPLVK